MRETLERLLCCVKSSVLALARHVVAVGFLRGTSRATELASPLHVGPILRRFRVLGGPLRGLQLVVPSFWRPSYALGTHEPRVPRVVRPLQMTGSVAYDVGANVGYFSAVFSRLVYRDGNPAPSLLEIDVEGAEDRVLRGAARTRRDARPVVVAESGARTPGGSSPRSRSRAATNRASLVTGLGTGSWTPR